MMMPRGKDLAGRKSLWVRPRESEHDGFSGYFGAGVEPPDWVSVVPPATNVV